MELNDFKPLITEIILCISEGKYDELQKASKDKEYQKKLLAEYGLLNEKQGE